MSFLTALSWNIDTNMSRTEAGYARDTHAAWRIAARLPLLQETLGRLILEYDVDVVHVQEARKMTFRTGEVVDSLTPLRLFLESQGFDVVWSLYHPHGMAFAYISAVRRDRWSFVGHRVFYLTQTPQAPTPKGLSPDQSRRHNLGESRERSTLMGCFQNQAGQKIYAFNVHLGVGKEHRLQATTLLGQFAEKLRAEDPQAKIIMMGDFNAFPEGGGDQQALLLTQGGLLQEDTHDLRFPDGAKARSTFIAFPFDLGMTMSVPEVKACLASVPPQEKKKALKSLFAQRGVALGGRLDRSFSRGLSLRHGWVIPTPQYGPLRGYQEADIKGYILQYHEQGPAFLSDHQPLVMQWEMD
jgi:endonuclease/exonuclease/phosphatase family metal-dependent hydrolase